MSEQKDMSGDKTLSGGGFNINPVDIIMYLLSKWYWFVLSVSLFGGYAWYQYAKLPFIYSRSATVMIKDAYSNNIGRGLDRFNTYSYTNVSNEILQFQSHKLMRDVPEAQRLACGLTDRVLRMSVGIEDEQDLLADLTQAIESFVP